MNKQNSCYNASENPQNFHEQPLHSPKIPVWCAVSKKLITDPYFYEEQRNIVTDNGIRYMGMLHNILKPELYKIK